MATEILNAYVSDEDLVLIGRTEAGVVVRGKRAAERSVFLKAADVGDTVRRQLSDSPLVQSIKLQGEWLRIIFGKGGDRKGDVHKNRANVVEWLRKLGISTFEGDVGPVRRYLADTGAKIGKPRRAYIDFEADARKGFDPGVMRLISWAVMYDDGSKRVEVLKEETNASEAELIRSFWAAIKDVEQIVAWNGDRFDFPFIQARSERLDILIQDGIRIRDWLWMDMMLAYKRLGTQGAAGDEKESAALEAVGQAVLGKGKTEVPDFVVAKYGKLRSLGSLSYDLWHDGGEFRALLREYNLNDVELMRDIEAKIGVLAMHDSICQACQVLPDSMGLLPTQHVEGFMLRLGVERNIHFKTRWRQDDREEEEQFRGAYVMPPQIIGRVENVHVGDFASMYPSIIISWNLSPETKDMSVAVDGPIPDGYCRTPETKIGFRTTEVGLLPLAIMSMLKLRKFWADKKASLTPGTEEWVNAGRCSDGYKIAVNSFYGVAGNRYSRFYDRDVAEATATTGAWLIKQVMQEAEARRLVPLYADTDSNFIGECTREQFQQFIDYLNNEAFPRWTSEYGCRENRLKIAYEKAFESIILLGKKRYCGRYSHYKGTEATIDSKPEVRGLEYRRGDTGRLARALQKRVIYDLLGIGKPAILDPIHYEVMLRECQRHISDDELDVLDITLSKSLSKKLENYNPKMKKDNTPSTLPAHVQVGKMLSERGQNIYDGSRISYFIKDGSKQPIKYAPAEDYRGDFDRHYLYEHFIAPPTLRILEAVFPGRPWQNFARTRPCRTDHVLPGQVAFKFSSPPGSNAKKDT